MYAGKALYGRYIGTSGKDKEYVDEGSYFAVNRARQYGKTTTLNALKRRLENDYKVFLISFEGIEEVFADSGAFCVRLIGLLYDNIDFGEVSGIPEEIKEEMYQRSIGKSQEMDFRILTNLLSRLCQRSEKPVVLTSGYPFLVSRICKLVDEVISEEEEFAGKNAAWTKEGVLAAIRRLLMERNTLFESLINY